MQSPWHCTQPIDLGVVPQTFLSKFRDQYLVLLSIIFPTHTALAKLQLIDQGNQSTGKHDWIADLPFLFCFGPICANWVQSKEIIEWTQCSTSMMVCIMCAIGVHQYQNWCPQKRPSKMLKIPIPNPTSKGVSNDAKAQLNASNTCKPCPILNSVQFKQDLMMSFDCALAKS